MTRRAAPLLIVVAASLVACAGCAPARVENGIGIHATAQPLLGTSLSTGEPTRGRGAFIELRCHTCHRVAEDGSVPAFPGAWEGPLLQHLGRESAEAVAWKIVTRTSAHHDAVFESPMSESASAMTERQLADVVAYLRDPAAKVP